MRKFFRKVFANIICISVQNEVYNYDPNMIEALFRTYEVHPILEEGTEFNYYIVSDDSGEIVVNNYTYCSKCDFKNSYWRFKLIKDLEIFYGKVLNSIAAHGSCVRYLGKNILLLGTRWSGKTTLTHYISTEKSGVYIDDDCVYINGNSIIGFSMPLPVRNPNVCQNSSFFLTETLDTDGIERTLFLPPRYLGAVSGIDVILFPSYKECGKNTIKRINEDIAFKNIISNIRSHNNIYSLFRTCNQLARGCLCFELQYTNSENACILIEKEFYHETLNK